MWCSRSFLSCYTVSRCDFTILITFHKIAFCISFALENRFYFSYFTFYVQRAEWIGCWHTFSLANFLLPFLLLSLSLLLLLLLSVFFFNILIHNTLSVSVNTNCSSDKKYFLPLTAFSITISIVRSPEGEPIFVLSRRKNRQLSLLQHIEVDLDRVSNVTIFPYSQSDKFKEKSVLCDIRLIHECAENYMLHLFRCFSIKLISFNSLALCYYRFSCAQFHQSNENCNYN